MLFYPYQKKSGFTVFEITVVILILGILIAVVWVAMAPYMARSRDTSRIADIQSLGNVFMAYRQNFDTFPSNYGSGGNPLASGYCVSEIINRPDGSTSDMKFSSLTKGVSIPKERALPIPGLCSSGNSYTYIVHTIGGEQYAFVASSLEISSTANLGNAGYLRNNPPNTARILELFSSPKDGVAMDGGDSIHYIAMK